MDELRDRVDEVIAARAALNAAMESRNDLMIELKAAGVPERNLMKLTGLSRDSVARITQGAKKAAALELESRVSRAYQSS